MRKIIIYDFDGTLTPYSITNFKILEVCGFVGGGNNKDLQNMVIKKMKEENKSIYLSFYEIILEIIELNGYPLKDEILSLGADKIDYNNGVYDFLKTLYNNKIENYIVSSSIKPFLDKIDISNYFKKIYATTFNYDSSNNITNINYLMTDDKKIEVIKEIVGNNDYKNVIYIGDGLTDLKAMEYIKSNGGISIYVGDEELDLDKKNVVSYFFNRDYSKDSKLSNFIFKLFEIKNTQL